jgi:hypothetical protein
MKPEIAESGHWKSVMGPVARIVLAVLMVGGGVAIAQVVVKTLKGALSLGGLVPAVYYLVYLIVSVLVTYFIYRVYVRFIEKRALPELSGDGAPGELGIGMLVGLSLRCRRAVVAARLLSRYWLQGVDGSFRGSRQRRGRSLRGGRAAKGCGVQDLRRAPGDVGRP